MNDSLNLAIKINTIRTNNEWRWNENARPEILRRGERSHFLFCGKWIILLVFGNWKAKPKTKKKVSLTNVMCLVQNVTTSQGHLMIVLLKKNWCGEFRNIIFALNKNNDSSKWVLREYLMIIPNRFLHFPSAALSLPIFRLRPVHSNFP